MALRLGMHPVVIDSSTGWWRAGRGGGTGPDSRNEVKGMRNVYLTVYRATPPNEEVGIEEGMDPGVARILLEMKGFRVRGTVRAIRIADRTGARG